MKATKKIVYRLQPARTLAERFQVSFKLEDEYIVQYWRGMGRTKKVVQGMTTWEIKRDENSLLYRERVD